jgi:integrase
MLIHLNIPYRKMSMTRHTFASRLLQSGYTINQVAKMLGHSTIQMVIKHYNKFLQDEISMIDTSKKPFENKGKCVNVCVTA